MIYDKRALTLEQQADLLLQRGLAADREALIGRLRAVNYYRLKGYLHPFRLVDSQGKRLDAFRPGTTLDTIWRRYNFDRRLRIILLDAIERIEVALRSRLVHHFVLAHGPFGHLRQENLPGFARKSDRAGWLPIIRAYLTFKGRPQSPHGQWLQKLNAERKRALSAKNKFVGYFHENYGDSHSQLPLWMACELMTCDTALSLAYAMDRELFKKVATDFGFPDDQLLSWTKGIFTLRNACAHHARIWNRVGGATPCMPGNKNKNPNWYVQPRFAPDRMGHALTVCHHWLGKVSSTSQWKARLFDFFDEYPKIPLNEMGIPANWRTHPLWT